MHGSRGAEMESLSDIIVEALSVIVLEAPGGEGGRICGRAKSRLADDRGQYLFEDPENASLRLKKEKAK